MRSVSPVHAALNLVPRTCFPAIWKFFLAHSVLAASIRSRRGRHLLGIGAQLEGRTPLGIRSRSISAAIMRIILRFVILTLSLGVLWSPGKYLISARVASSASVKSRVNAFNQLCGPSSLCAATRSPDYDFATGHGEPYRKVLYRIAETT